MNQKNLNQSNSIIINIQSITECSILFNLHSLALNQALHMRKNAQHHMLNGALLLKDHSRQIQQHLIALNLQLGLFVQLGIAQADAAELQIRREHTFVVLRKAFAIQFVDHLGYADHHTGGVLDGHTEKGFGAIAGLTVHFVVKASVLWWQI